MFTVCKTVIGKEYMRSREYSILCNSKKQAETLAETLNKNNSGSIGGWKLKEGEAWHTYTIDNYDHPPTYRLKSTRGKISVVLN